MELEIFSGQINAGHASYKLCSPCLDKEHKDYILYPHNEKLAIAVTYQHKMWDACLGCQEPYSVQ